MPIFKIKKLTVGGMATAETSKASKMQPFKAHILTRRRSLRNWDDREAQRVLEKVTDKKLRNDDSKVSLLHQLEGRRERANYYWRYMT